MKSLNLFSILILCLFFTSCDDEKTESKISNVAISVTVKNTETYSHDFGLIGIEDGGAIKIAPQHASVSTFARNNQNHLIYTYTPEDNFTGIDKAQIEICHSAGTASCYATVFTTFNFTVTN